MAIIGYVALGVLVLLVLGNVFTYLLQDLFIFRPERLPADHRFAFDAPFEELTIAVRHGMLNALWFRRPAGQAVGGVVLYFHGNSGSLRRWGNLYLFFFRHDYDFFAYDYRGFGKSRGRRNEELLHEDARTVYRHLRRFYPPEKIVIFGRSIGSAFASRLAAEHPARCLILETPFAGMPELFYTYYPFLPRLFRFKYRFANRTHLERVTCPVYVFQGTNDWIVPLRCAVQLRAALKPGDEFTVIGMGRHNDLMIYADYQQGIARALKTPEPEEEPGSPRTGVRNDNTG